MTAAMAQVQKNSGLIGYAWLRDRFQLPSFLGAREARVAATNAVVVAPDGGLLVPSRMAPGAGVLEHILFALKHEDINLYVLSVALKSLPAADLEEAFSYTPNGVYVRTACHLWELMTGGTLEQRGGAITAPYQEVFDPDRYFTGQSRRSPKWRMDFNGLGSVTFCPVIRKTPEILHLLGQDILGQTRKFAESVGPEMLERALGWAYMSETEGSFAIEGQVPSLDKAQAFTNLLKQAGEPRLLTEDLLCELQRITVTNEYDKAWEFRSEQNRLQKGVGAVGVTYVPPKPALVPPLMDELMLMANNRPADLDPIVHAAAISFGFVLIHPFMDGNGRLSRFLIHHCLGQAGVLPRSLVLPVSVAMKRHESDYLAALVTFSKPARDLCDVTWAGDDRYIFDWKANADEAFRYMDLSEAAEFTLRMAQAALEQDLHGETVWLTNFDAVYTAIKQSYDVRDADLSVLIAGALKNGGAVSKNKRKSYLYRVPDAVFDAIEAHCMQILGVPDQARAGAQENDDRPRIDREQS